MLPYRAPVRDLRFVHFELFDAARVAALPGFEEASEELVTTIAEEIGRFASEVLLPLNAVGDHDGLRFENGRVTMPAGFVDAYRQYREGGWTALTARPEYGGQGLPHFVGNLVEEILCSTNLSFAMMTALTHGAYAALDQHATEELKRRFLPKIVDGTWAATMCLTEPQAGTDLGLVRTTATPVTDGEHAGACRIRGGKIFISAGEHDLTANIVHLILARLPDAPPGIKGISLFVVPKLREENGRLVPNGVSCTSIEHKMGIKASPTCAIAFDDALGWLVGEPHRGMKAMFTFMNGARLHVGIQGLALAEAASQAAVAFAKERLQGRAARAERRTSGEADPIVVHPDVRRLLLSIRAFVEGARALTAWISHEIDHADSNPDAARAEEGDDLASLLTPVVKAFQTDLGFEATNLALQVLGGYGYCTEYGVEQLVRDCRITQIYEGTNGVQAMDLVGRKLPMEGGRLWHRFARPVRAFFDEESANAELAPYVAPAKAAFERLEKATGFLAKSAPADPDALGAAATDYLHLFGWTALAWLWAKSAKVALAKLPAATSEADRDFYAAKLATARFFFERLLPRHLGHFAALTAGSGAIVEFPDAAF